MTSFDFAPLYRTAIGFDRLARLANTAQAEVPAYPPYNIERTGEDSYRLVMAVAGFGPDDIDLTVKDNNLIVAGKSGADVSKSELLYRGIAGRSFERRFALADHIVVEGADLQNGLLNVGLRRVVPESLKPRRVVISTTPTVGGQTIGAQSVGTTSIANDAQSGMSQSGMSQSGMSQSEVKAA